MAQIINYLHALVGRKDDKGAAMVEYGILIAGIAVVVAVAVFALGGVISDLFNGINFDNPTTPTTP